jgi:arylsulfatase A-like enzyme
MGSPRRIKSKRSRAVGWSLLVLGAATLGLVVYSEIHSPAHPNVLVILLDTTRADHLGVFGYERDTSANIDRFARENVCFTHAFTAAPWTPPSVATLFSGLYASSHGMMPPDQTPTEGIVWKRLDENVLTLAEILKGAEYRTAAISPNPWITPEFGYGQGFDSFTAELDDPADAVTTAGLERIDELKESGEPFFLYLHYLDPHAPYLPPKEHDIYRGPLKQAHYAAPMMKGVNRYDGEIHYVDESLGRLFEGLKARGVYDDLTIVLLGDHGEQFEEHGNLGHGWQLFNEELHVPLIVKPGRMAAASSGSDGREERRTGRRIDRVVSIVDVLPTVLALADVEAPAGLPGLNLLDDAALAVRPGVFAEIDRRLSLRAFVGANGKKLILGSKYESVKFNPARPLENGFAVFDWNTPERDPIEDLAALNDLESEFVEVLQRVQSARVIPAGSDSESVTPSVETLQHLHGLGYVK